MVLVGVQTDYFVTTRESREGSCDTCRTFLRGDLGVERGGGEDLNNSSLRSRGSGWEGLVCETVKKSCLLSHPHPPTISPPVQGFVYITQVVWLDCSGGFLLSFVTVCFFFGGTFYLYVAVDDGCQILSYGIR